MTTHLSFDRGPGGYVDVDAILRELNRHPFKEWPVKEIMGCPQPKVYDGARRILADRCFPYLRAVLHVMEEYDISIDLSRVDFVLEMLDNEMADVVDRMALEKNVKNVLWGYSAGLKKLKRKLIDPDNRVAHDMALGLAASIKLEFDILKLLGFQIVPRGEGSKHPLDHNPLKLP